MSCYPVIIVLNMALQSGHNFNSFHTSTSTFVSNFVASKINLFGVVVWCAVFCSDGGGADVQMGRVARPRARQALFVFVAADSISIFNLFQLHLPLLSKRKMQPACHNSYPRSPSPPLRQSVRLSNWSAQREIWASFQNC